MTLHEILDQMHSAPEFFGEDEFLPKDFGYSIDHSFADDQPETKQPMVRHKKGHKTGLFLARSS